MISDSVEFPCLEAARCHVTEKELGMRLTVSASGRPFKNRTDPSTTKRFVRVSSSADSKEDTNDTNELQKAYTISFSKSRTTSQEWYCHMDSVSRDHGLTQKRILQLRHSETGQYLFSDGEGNVGCSSIPSPSTFWYMEPAVSATIPSPLPPSLSRNVSVDSDDSFFSQSTGGSSHHRESNQLDFVLVSKEFPHRRLSYLRPKGGHSFPDASLGAHRPSKLTLITTECGEESVSGHVAVWELHFTSGELCFISSPVLHCQVSCNMIGKLSLSTKFGGWQVFRFIELGNGDVAISSWTHFTKFLSSDADGQVHTVDGNKRGLTERWRLEPSASRNGVCIKSTAYQRYLCVGRIDNEALWTTTKPNDYAVWHLDAAHSHVYYLTSVGSNPTASAAGTSSSGSNDENEAVQGNSVGKSKKFTRSYSLQGESDLHISSSKKGPFMTRNKRKWEEWQLKIDDGYVTFFSKAHKKFLGCNSSGQVHTTTSRGPWCRWEMEESPFGGILLRSREHNRYLAIDTNEGTLCTTADDLALTLANSWRLDPQLPHTISAGKIAVLSAVGILGVAVTVAMPFAVLGAMEAAGIAVTELAVAGLSAEALAGAGAGAIIGVGMVGTTAAFVPDDPRQNFNPMDLNRSMSKDSAITSQRPISAWRTWVNN